MIILRLHDALTVIAEILIKKNSCAASNTAKFIQYLIIERLIYNSYLLAHFNITLFFHLFTLN